MWEDDVQPGTIWILPCSWTPEGTTDQWTPDKVVYAFFALLCSCLWLLWNISHNNGLRHSSNKPSLSTTDSMSHSLSQWHGLNIEPHSLNEKRRQRSSINSGLAVRRWRWMRLIWNQQRACWHSVLWSHSSSWQPSQSCFKKDCWWEMSAMLFFTF